MRCQPSAIVRVCAVAVLALVAFSFLPTPVGLAQSAPPPTPWRGFIDHVSATQTGNVPTTGVEVANRAISGDGRFVVMQSLSQDLVAGDLTWGQDIFLRDRQTGTMTRVSVAEDGTDPDGFSEAATISTNGQHVAFMSGAANLVAGDTNATQDIFVRDLVRARTVRVSVASDGIQGDGSSYMPAISATGRFVAFVSQASTLVPGQPLYAPMQVYLHDRDADGNGTFDEPSGITTTLESVSASGAVADNYSHHVRVSADGRFVLFESSATNLDAAGNPGGSNHVYLRDRQAGTTTMIDRAVTGAPSIWGADYRTADMTDDGRFITYSSYSPDIVAMEGTWNSQVLRYDRLADAPRTRVVTALPDGTPGNGYTFDTSVSADGRYVAFRSTSTNLAAPAQPENGAGVFVRDMTTGTFTRVDVLNNGEGFDHSFPYAPSISADGTAVAFMSNAVNAVDGAYTFGSQHTFVVSAFSVSATSASFPTAGGSGAIDVAALPVSGWNAVSLDSWIVLTDGAGFAAGSRTVNFTVESNPSPVVRHGRIRLGSTIVAIQQDGDGDTTPPVITPIVTGTLSPSGWYTSDITVQWSVTDPDSEILSTGYGCVTSTFTSDFMHASPTCEATSHGGTASVSVPLRRDTTPPSITINSPAPAYYRTGTSIPTAFGCEDPSGHSGVASCQRTGGSGPLDTTTPGWHPFTVTAVDQAGNATSKTVEYLIGTGVCMAQPAGLKAWWRFNSTMFDTVARLQASPSHAGGFYDNAVAGKGWTNNSSANRLVTSDGLRLLMPSAVTVALWVKPTGFSGQSGTLVTKPAHYRIARYPDGTLRWAFSHTTGYNWVNTGAVIPLNLWSHVAVTYDQGLVRSYLNGRLVHTQQLSGTLVFGAHEYESLTIAGRNDVAATLLGTFDDVQIYDRAMAAADVDTLARAGSGTLCVPNGSTLTVTTPPTIAYGSTFNATAVLQDESGNPIPNRQVWLRSHVSPFGFTGAVSATTNAAGQASANLPVAASAAPGVYAPAAVAVFEGDVVYRESNGEASATLVGGTPSVTWPSPAAIVYGTPLTATQLNATASVPGSFVYTPAAGTILGAGTQPLGMTFMPTDSTHWAQTTAVVTVTVNKATPVVTVTGGTFTYNGQPHAGTGTVTGVLGEALSPLQILYNGASGTPPTDAGAHTVRASFGGSANYAPAQSGDAPLVINRAAPIMSLAAETVTYDGQPHGASAAVVGINNEFLTPVTITYNGSPTMPSEAGTYAVEARFEGSTNYTPVVRTATLTIVKARPYLQWFPGPGSIVYGTPLGAAHLAATASVPGTFSYAPGPGTILTAGVHTITATFTPADTVNYTTASTTATVVVTKASPTIAWPNPAAVVYGTALSAAQLNASASVPGTFTYAPAAGAVLSAGTHVLSVSFTPDDAANYNAVSTGAVLTVTKATATLTWNSPASIVYGSALTAAQLNATANVPGTFIYSPADGTILDSGTHSVSVIFTPEDTANWSSQTTATVTITVDKATPAVTVTGGTFTYDGQAHGASAAAAGINNAPLTPVAITYNGSPVMPIDAGTYAVEARYEGSTNYTPAVRTATVSIVKAVPNVQWSPGPGSIVHGTPLGAAHLAATAGVPGTFSYAPGAGTILSAGDHTITATFTPADAVNYTTASTTATINVAKTSPTIAWPDPAAFVYGTALSAAELNATANVPGTFTYSPAAGTLLPAGTHALSVTFTPSDGANYTGATMGRMLNVAKAPLSIAANNAAKPFGAPLPPFSVTAAGFVNGDSMASLGGLLTFATPAAPTSPVGTYPLVAQGLSSPNYAIAFVSGTLTVARAETALAIGASPNPAGVNQPVTYTAAIAVPAPGAGTPAGAVQFFDNGTLVGTAPLVAGSASLTTNGISAGTHSISATYGGDASFAASSATTALTVRSASTSSTTTLTSTRNPANVGQTVTFRATVSGPTGSVSGTVEFYDGADLLGSAALSGGVAQLTTASLPPGGHAIVARYLGNGSLPPSVSPALAQTVGSQSKSSSTAVSISPSPAALGTDVTMTATVTGGQQRAPGGVVLFIVNGQILGQVPTTVTGSVTAAAVLRTNALPRGTHTIMVVYLGDATYRASSRSATLTIN